MVFYDMFDIEGFKKILHSEFVLPSGTCIHLANDSLTLKALNVAINTLF